MGDWSPEMVDWSDVLGTIGFNLTDLILAIN
jgi:hypothetical protein